MHILTDNQKQIYHNVGPSNAIEYHGKMLDAIKEKNAEVASIYARKSIEESIKRIEERRRMRKLSKEEDSE
jgi:DNA-binding GntR family transcriptional regulator